MDNEVPAYMDENAIPECEEQSAIVTDNNDPEGMSRIRVQFPWQEPTQGQSPWIRVTTPYAGKGKGMHVIPEIGEEVIVSFENGNAEKPVVIGAMFNGEGKSGHGGAGNYIKGLQTPTGNKLQFNDQEGSALLTDNGGVNMKFDGKGNATTNASSTQIINVGGGVGEQGPMPPTSILKMDNEGNITIDGKTNITLKVGTNSITITEAGIKIYSESGFIDLESGASNKIKAGSIDLNTKGYIQLTSTGNTTITANKIIEN